MSSEQTFEDLLTLEGSLSFDDVLLIFEDLLEALIELHATGAVHGELSPEIVLVHPDNEQLRARIDDAAPAADPVECRAPEQISGANVDARADLYAIGSMAFRALTGRWPFEGRTPEEIWNLKQTMTAPSLSVVTGEQWPSPLEAWVAALLAKMPRDRIESAELALDALTVMSRRVAATKPPPP